MTYPTSGNEWQVVLDYDDEDCHRVYAVNNYDEAVEGYHRFASAQCGDLVRLIRVDGVLRVNGIERLVLGEDEGRGRYVSDIMVPDDTPDGHYRVLNKSTVQITKLGERICRIRIEYGWLTVRGGITFCKPGDVVIIENGQAIEFNDRG